METYSLWYKFGLGEAQFNTIELFASSLVSVRS